MFLILLLVSDFFHRFVQFCQDVNPDGYTCSVIHAVSCIMSFDAEMLKAHLASEDSDEQSSEVVDEVDDEDPDETEEEDDNSWFRPHPKFPGKLQCFALAADTLRFSFRATRSR